MTHKSFSLTAGILFLVIAIVHGLRIIFGWDAILEGHHVPMWASWIAILIAGYLAYGGLKLSRRP